MDILYYSNYCKHCEKVVKTLVKGNLIDKLSFVCIDKRVRDEKTNQVYIQLENGKKVNMPPNLTNVPALLLVSEKYRFIYGDDIIKRFHKDILEKNEKATKNNGEPFGYYLGGSNSGCNIMSEKYTMYNMSADELSAKGNSNRRDLYNYVSANDDIITINTPADTYQPDKIGNGLTVDKLQQQRIDEINGMVPRQPAFSSQI
jgi:hypothetical protein